MKANVEYRLSQVGQKAALIAGRTATIVVVETLEFSDPNIIHKLYIKPDSTMGYDCSGYGYPELDAPPTDLAGLIATMEAHMISTMEAHKAAKEAAKGAADGRVAEATASGSMEQGWDEDMETSWVPFLIPIACGCGILILIMTFFLIKC